MKAMMLTEKIDREQMKDLSKPLNKGLIMVDIMLRFAQKQGQKGVITAECRELLKKLRISERDSSITPRFNEMVAAGMLIPTRERRMTTEGKTAVVHVAREGATLLDYAKRPRRKKVTAEDGRDEEAVMAAYRILRRQWSGATVKQREKLALKLVDVATRAAQAAMKLTKEP